MALRNIIAQAWGCQKQLPVCTPVALSVVDTDAVQPLSAGGIGLVHGQDSTALGGNSVLQGYRCDCFSLGLPILYPCCRDYTVVLSPKRLSYAFVGFLEGLALWAAQKFFAVVSPNSSPDCSNVEATQGYL